MIAPAAHPRYPSRVQRLSDGSDVVLRPICPDDAARETEFIRGLSRDAGYNRLLGYRKLTPEEIRRLTCIDPEREMAYIAVDGNAANARMLGVARYVRDADAGGAEFALVVADAWQRRGLGTLLVRTLLRHAQSDGITRLHGTTLASNQAMLKLAHKLGFALQLDRRDATVRLLEKTLAPAAAPANLLPSAAPAGVAANDEGGAPRLHAGLV